LDKKSKEAREKGFGGEVVNVKYGKTVY